MAVAGPYTVWDNGQSPFCELLFEYLHDLNENVSQVSLVEDVINVMPYLCSRRKVRIVKTLPVKIVHKGEASMGSFVKVYCVPSVIKANCG